MSVLEKNSVWVTLVDGSRYRTSRVRTVVNIFAVLLILLFGWMIRGEYLIDAEYGLGYALGIIGGTMMLVLLIYPLRKRLPRSRWFVLSVPGWFRFHMLLGVLGPLAILYHSNFSLGSTNSNIALVSMLLMATSGLVGRYIYSRIHAGLYGKRLEMAELIDDKQYLAELLRSDENILVSDDLLQKMASFETLALPVKKQKNESFGSRFNAVWRAARETRQAAKRLEAQLREEQFANPWFAALPKSQQKQLLSKSIKHLRGYLALVRRIAELDFFERMFSLWHMLHMPIFFLLIIAGFVHVYAVHTY